MKLIINVPCFNEEKTLPLVFKKMPRKIPGIDIIEYQIIDDGSTDKTSEIAKKLGIHHILRFRGKNRRWLGRAFKRAVDNALKEGADIFVNTDGDNQYPSEEITELIKPILDGTADIVIGDRQTAKIDEFSVFKKMLQKVGSFTTQLMSGEKVPDAVSGFRAYSREALEKINIVTDFTYTVDTLMQAHKKGIDVAWIPIKTNPKTRDSRLIKNIWSKVKKSGGTIVRMYTIYEPFKTFLYLSSIFFAISAYLIVRYFYFFFILAETSGHLQSLLAGGVSFVIGIQLFALGILADLLSVNRRLVEEALNRIKQLQYKKR